MLSGAAAVSIVAGSDVVTASGSTDIMGIGQSRRLPHLKSQAPTSLGCGGTDSSRRINRNVRSRVAPTMSEAPLIFKSRLGKPALCPKASRSESAGPTCDLDTNPRYLAALHDTDDCTRYLQVPVHFHDTDSSHSQLGLRLPCLLNTSAEQSRWTQPRSRSSHTGLQECSCHLSSRLW